jgi:hypothetical protein
MEKFILITPQFIEKLFIKYQFKNNTLNSNKSRYLDYFELIGF